MSVRVPDGSDRGMSVVVTAPGCWCEGRRGVIVGTSSTPGFFTVKLDGGREKFQARIGEVAAAETFPAGDEGGTGR